MTLKKGSQWQTRLIMSPSFSAGSTGVTYLELEDILDGVEFLLISAIDLSETTTIVPIPSVNKITVVKKGRFVQKQLLPSARVH
jgi:hypothetical protein